MTAYNGHKNWNHWNVSLWIHNDEVLYFHAKDIVRANRRLDDAARRLLLDLDRMTPDGAPYTFSSVRAALSRDM